MGKLTAKDASLASGSGLCHLTLDRKTAKDLLLALTTALDAGGSKGKSELRVKATGPKAPGPKR
jgi:hypothetical protein